MVEYPIKLPDRDGAISCNNEAEVGETLREYLERNPGADWTGIWIYEMPPGSTAGTKRKPSDFVED